MVSSYLKMKIRGVFKKTIDDVREEAKSSGMTVNEFYDNLYEDFYAPIIKLEKQNTVASNRKIKILKNDVKKSNNRLLLIRIMYNLFNHNKKLFHLQSLMKLFKVSML
jgi:hypothetical protein